MTRWTLYSVIVRDPHEDMDTRLRAAAIAAPFCHAKGGESGKKMSVRSGKPRRRWVNL